MAPHTLNALYRDLKRDALSPAYYFHGPEDVLKDDAVTAWTGCSIHPCGSSTSIS
jgi:hypothetical protein